MAAPSSLGRPDDSSATDCLELIEALLTTMQIQMRNVYMYYSAKSIDGLPSNFRVAVSVQSTISSDMRKQDISWLMHIHDT